MELVRAVCRSSTPCYSFWFATLPTAELWSRAFYVVRDRVGESRWEEE